MNEIPPRPSLSWYDRYGGLSGWLKAQGLIRADRQGLLAASLQPDWASVRRLVFVCTGNLYRSPFARELADRLGVPAASFGIHAEPGRRAPEAALGAAQSFGVGLLNHRAMPWLEFAAEPGDLLAVMEGWHHRVLTQRAFDPSRVTFLGHWAEPRSLHIPDPAGRGPGCLQASYALVASGVRGMVAAWGRGA